MNDDSREPASTPDAPASPATPPAEATPSAERHDTTAKEELFEAIDHFKAAAAKLFERASKAPAISDVSRKVDDVAKKANEVAKKVEHSPPLKKVEELADKLDPAFDAAAKEAERVITKLGATAEPLARQLSSELGKLTKRITEQVGDLSAKRKTPAAEERQTTSEERLGAPDEGDKDSGVR